MSGAVYHIDRSEDGGAITGCQVGGRDSSPRFNICECETTQCFDDGLLCFNICKLYTSRV